MKNKIKLNKKIIILIIIVLLLILLSIAFGTKPIRDNIISLFQREEVIQEIDYEIYSNENNILKYIVTITDTENGIQEIIYPNGEKLVCNGKTQVGIDYVIEENGTYTFTAKTTNGKQITKDLVVDDDYRANKIIPVERLYEIATERNYRVDYNYKNIQFSCYYAIGEDSQEWIGANNGIVINVDGYDAYHKNKVNEDGTVTLKLKKVDRFGNTVEIKYAENYNIGEDFFHEEDVILEGDSIIACVRENEIKSGNYILEIRGETYPAEIYNYDEDVNYITNKNLGTTENDKRMLIMKYNKNLNIRENSNVITAQARKKGMLLCVEGELENNGVINMTAKGANALGQNVYLLEDEYVPAVGARFGFSTSITTKKNTVESVAGNKAADGINRQTGGGGAGAAAAQGYDKGDAHHSITAVSGSGSSGTSYSGGTGGGAGYAIYSSYNSQVYTKVNGTNGIANGGAGGTGHLNRNGAGNPTGGTGGLLILYANTFNNKGNILSNGSFGHYAYSSSKIGGGSGGGSINIFYQSLIQEGNISATAGGNGGNGSVTLQEITKDDNLESEIDRTIYVSKNVGNDTTGDGSPEKPYATLDKITEAGIIENGYNYEIMLLDGEYILDEKMFNLECNRKINIIGNKNNTILVANSIYANYSGGKDNYVLNFYRLIWKADTMATNAIFPKISMNFYNIVFDIKYDAAEYSYFLPNLQRHFNFYNCTLPKVVTSFLRCDNGIMRLTNCYGGFTSGYGTTDSMWNYKTNYITSTPNVNNENYRILDDESKWKNVGTGTDPDGTQADLGVYGGEYSWEN